MKKFLLAAALGASISAPAMAADMPVKAAPMAVAVFSWTGCYIGGHGGMVVARKRFTGDFDESVGFDRGGHNPHGMMLGGQLGCDWQQGTFVYGVYVDGSWSNASASHTDQFNGDFQQSTRVRALGSVGGRIGFTWTPRWLIYITGGWAWERDRHNILETGTGDLEAFANANRQGWTIGAGSEFALGSNWSAFSQWNYYDFGTKRIEYEDVDGGFFTQQRIRERKWAWRVGLNYRFGGASIVSARN